jgi:hypothetical protein
MMQRKVPQRKKEKTTDEDDNREIEEILERRRDVSIILS